MRHYRRSKADERLAEARKHGLKAWRKRDEAARLAIPPAPPDLRPGEQWMHWPMSGIGWAADVRLLIPPNKGRRRPRSDQFTLLVNDEVIGQRMGLGAIWRHLQKCVIPKQSNREQRHEANAIHFSSLEDDLMSERGGVGSRNADGWIDVDQRGQNACSQAPLPE